MAPATPRLKDAICISGCAGLRMPTVGGTVQASGANMAYVKTITFRGSTKRIPSTVVHTTNTTAEAPVPAGAKDGRIRVKDSYGEASELSPTALHIAPKSALNAGSGDSTGPLPILEAQVTPSKAYYFGVAQPTLAFILGGAAAQNLRVDVVTDVGQVVKSFFLNGVAPNTTTPVAWDGTDSTGAPAAAGHYTFRIGLASSPSATASQAVPGDTGVDLYAYIFPLRGKHNFGDAGARFGAPRSGHIHQGQDIMADCGTKIVAARGGRVQYNGYQSAAGNYIVIDQKGSGEDNAYMHLAQPSPLPTGSVVRTGQQIGVVGETGDATACHLHFERWSPPGWYEGGHPFDPLPGLKQWDAYS
jgi:murein DD-endopeptidase MepM/ murein hydrolase activator NlpD